jgi:hypothetical protein
MPSTKTKFSCGHTGRGSAGCHRCAQADKILADLEALASKALPEEAGKGKAALEKELKAEAERLKAIPARKQSNKVKVDQGV